MNIVDFLIPVALLMAVFFFGAFTVSAKRGQFDDLETPAHRVLLDDELETKFSDAAKGPAK